ncbi:MAG: hypothetical protein ACI4TL_02345 [Candidatus Cryptobacteroides sp.]
MKMERKTIVESSDMMLSYIKYLKAAPALNTRRIFETWHKESGVSAYTLKLFFREGTLYVTLSSSVVRNSIKPFLNSIMAKMNQSLEEDQLFIKDDPKVGYVNKIIIK